MSSYSKGFFDGAVASAPQNVETVSGNVYMQKVVSSYAYSVKNIMGYVYMQEALSVCENSYNASGGKGFPARTSIMNRIRDEFNPLMHEKFKRQGKDYWSGYLAAVLEAEQVDYSGVLATKKIFMKNNFVIVNDIANGILMRLYGEIKKLEVDFEAEKSKGLLGAFQERRIKENSESIAAVKSFTELLKESESLLV